MALGYHISRLIASLFNNKYYLINAQLFDRIVTSEVIMTIKEQLGIILLFLLVGYGIGRYVQPAKIVTKTEIVTQTVVQDHIHTVTVTVTKPDGSKVTTTTKDNNSTIDKDTDSKSSTVTTYDKPQWKVSALAGLNYTSLSTPVYGGDVEKRLLGPIFVGAWGLTNGTAGVSLGLEF